MKKVMLLIPIFLLIIATTITKNSTKDLDKEIFQIKENLRALEDKYEFLLLDYNYLTSPKKLMEYSKKYFENEMIQKNIEDLNWLKINGEQIEVKKFGDLNE